MLYILKLSISLSVVYLFYQVLLRRLTFYNWNRWYLLLYSMICFFIPWVDIFHLLQQQGLQNAVVVHYIPAIAQITTAKAGAGSTAAGISNGMVFTGIFMAGSLFLFARLFLQYLSLKKIKTSAVLLTDGHVKIYHIDGKIIPFSIGNAIYVNRNLHEEQELREIIRHEFIHVKQKHSVDLWWSEILCILNWYNPFAWLLRHAIRQNLEFIADHEVLKSGLDARQYQYLLLKVTGNASFSIASNFNFSSLKKRIVMMNKNKSANRHLVRFLFMLPLLAVILLAFREVAVNSDNYYIGTGKKITDTVPARDASKSIKQLMKEKGVKSIRTHITENENKVYVDLLDGTTKAYDMDKPADKEAFEKEYGDIPPPPAPPAPVAAPRPAHAPAPPPPAKAGAPAAAPVPAKMPPPPPAKVPPPPPQPVKEDVAEVRVAGTMAVANEPSAPVKVVGIAIGAPRAIESASSGTVLRADLIEIRPANIPAAATVSATTIEETRNILEIRNTTTREELERMVEALKEEGYTLVLKAVTFNEGKLVTLEGSISNSEGKGGFYADNFKLLIVNVSSAHPDRFYIWVHSGSVRL